MKPGEYHFDTGKGVHGWWFQRWQAFNPAAASEMHQSSLPAPFTLSSLMGLPYATGEVVRIAAGQPSWLRITTLDEALDDLMLRPDGGWLQSLPPVMDIENLPWQVEAVHTRQNEHPWAGRARYDDLRALLDVQSPPANWSLELASPTAFNGRNGQFPFPLPDMMVRSWMDRWNIFAPFTFPDEILQAAREGLGVSSYRLRTQPLTEGKRRVIGCLGHISLRAVDLHPGLTLALNVLFEYAFFSGTGYHTTQGMGLTRLLPKEG